MLPPGGPPRKAQVGDAEEPERTRVVDAGQEAQKDPSVAMQTDESAAVADATQPCIPSDSLIMMDHLQLVDAAESTLLALLAPSRGNFLIISDGVIQMLDFTLKDADQKAVLVRSSGFRPASSSGDIGSEELSLRVLSSRIKSVHRFLLDSMNCLPILVQSKSDLVLNESIEDVRHVSLGPVSAQRRFQQSFVSCGRFFSTKHPDKTLIVVSGDEEVLRECDRLRWTSRRSVKDLLFPVRGTKRSRDRSPPSAEGTLEDDGALEVFEDTGRF